MKSFLFYFFIFFSFKNVAYSNEINLTCDLKKFFSKELVLEPEKQVPLSDVDPIYLEKITLSFDMENNEFLGSNLIFPIEFRKVLFTENEIYFMTKGFKNNDHVFYYDTRLNRISGELTRTIKTTENYVKKKLEDTGESVLGWQRRQVYQCKVAKKLF